jgi:hypothetical protein
VEARILTSAHEKDAFARKEQKAVGTLPFRERSGPFDLAFLIKV